MESRSPSPHSFHLFLVVKTRVLPAYQPVPELKGGSRDGQGSVSQQTANLPLNKVTFDDACLFLLVLPPEILGFFLCPHCNCIQLPESISSASAVRKFVKALAPLCCKNKTRFPLGEKEMTFVFWTNLRESVLSSRTSGHGFRQVRKTTS